MERDGKIVTLLFGNVEFELLVGHIGPGDGWIGGFRALKIQM